MTFVAPNRFISKFIGEFACIAPAARTNLHGLRNPKSVSWRAAEQKKQVGCLSHELCTENNYQGCGRNAKGTKQTHAIASMERSAQVKTTAATTTTTAPFTNAELRLCTNAIISLAHSSGKRSPTIAKPQRQSRAAICNRNISDCIRHRRIYSETFPTSLRPTARFVEFGVLLVLVLANVAKCVRCAWAFCCDSAWVEWTTQNVERSPQTPRNAPNWMFDLNVPGSLRWICRRCCIRFAT